jgi:hypothetical protein
LKIQGGFTFKMAQEADLTETGSTATEEERNRRSGRDMPRSDGGVSDEDVNAISNSRKMPKGKTGQDHSTEDYEKTIPDHGVGAVQDNSDTTSDIARIND